MILNLNTDKDSTSLVTGNNRSRVIIVLLFLVTHLYQHKPHPLGKTRHADPPQPSPNLGSGFPNPLFISNHKSVNFTHRSNLDKPQHPATFTSK